jgi:hypothetical protein
MSILPSGDGLLAQYFDNSDFTNLKLTRIDTAINFNWGTGTPDPSLGADTFSVRWTGQVQPLYSERYIFYTTSDDGVRLWVNNQLIIDRWVDQGATEWSGSIDLVAGQKYDIKMEYYENGGDAVANLSWSSPSQGKQIIPTSQLYTGGTTIPGTLAFSAPAFSVNEDGTLVAAVTVTRTGGSSGAVSATITLGNGTATSADYTSTPIVVSFANGDTTAKTITIPIVNDTLDENDETINLTLGSPTGGATIGTQSTAVLTIVDNDPLPTVNLGPATISQNEGNSGTTAFNFTVSLSAASGRTVTVPYTTNNGTATAGSDYIDNDGSLTFNPGETSKTITVRVTGDTAVETNETFTVVLGTPTNATRGSIFQSTATIVNDDVSTPPPIGGNGLLAQYFDNSDFTNLKLTRTDAAVNFNWGSGTPDPSLGADTFSVRWTGQVQPLYSERYTFHTTSDDGVRLWVNNQLIIDRWVNQSPREWSGSIDLVAGQKYDIKMEYYENTGGAVANLSWSSPSQAKQIIPTSRLYTSSNIDPIEFSTSNFSVNENGTSGLAVTVIRSGDTSAAASITLTPSNGTATSGADFNNSPIVVNFNPGQTSTTVTIPIVDDNIDEPNETINLTLSNPSSGVLLGTRTTAVLTIVDNDPLPTVNLGPATISRNEGNSGTTAFNFTVSLSNPSSQSITVPYTTNNGTATAGSDYTDNDGSLTFNPGETSKIITVQVTGDTAVEANETFIVAQGTPTNATLGTSQSTATIVNDDVAGTPGTLAFSAPAFSVNENGTPVAAVTVTRTGGSSGAISATITLGNGTATAPADYANSPIVVTFAAGDTTAKIITIPIVNDNIYEGNETVNLTLSNPTGGATLGAINTAILTIVDDDPLPKVNLSPATLSLNEGNSGTTPFTFTVSLSNSSFQTISVPYTTNNGTATAGSDYIDNDRTLTFNPGETSKTITVSVNGDAIVEPNETFNVQLRTPTNAALGTTTQSNATIVDDDVTSFKGTGLKGEYYNDSTFANLVMTRIDPSIDFDYAAWYKTSSPNFLINPVNFSVRWTGTIQPLYSEKYTFSTTTDGGVSLWINDRLIINQQVDTSGLATYTGSINLQAGQKYNIRLEYTNTIGGSAAQLSWSSPSQSNQIVPQSQLYSVDITAPDTSLIASNFIANGADSYDFTVNYSDISGVNNSSVGSGDVVVVGPNGFNQIANLVSKSSSYDSNYLTATYRITAPGGTWDSSDTGNYTITLQPNQVSDTKGNTNTTPTLLGSFSFNTNSSLTLPNLTNNIIPIGNPVLPNGTDVFNPSLNGTTGSQSPIISNWNKDARPGDTIVLTGWNFSQLTGSQVGNDTKFWVYGQTQSGNGVLAQAKIQRMSGDLATITLPANLPQGSDYLLWAQNSSGISQPVLINDTEAWWIGPDAATRGQVTSIYGANLTSANGIGNTNVYIQDTAGKGYWAQVVAANPYKVDFVVPQGLINGNYQVWVHNGDGGQYGWSKPQTLIVNDGIKYPGSTFNVKDYGAKGDGVTDDTQALKNALWTASQKPGSTVYFPSGTYLLNESLYAYSNLRYLGDGQDQTIIKPKNGSTQSYVFNNDSTKNVTFQNLTVDTNRANAPNMVAGFSVVGSNLQFLNIKIAAEGTSPLGIATSDHVFIKDSTMIGKTIFLGGSKQVFIDNTKFYGTNYADTLISGFGVQNLSITNSTGQNLDNSSPTNGKWTNGRLFIDYGYWGPSENQYIGNNKTIDLAPSPDPAYAQQNAGEQLLWEPQSLTTLGTVINATSNSVSFSSVSGDSAYVISIVGGKGIGQTRQIQYFNSSTNTYQINDDWNVVPDSSSIMIASRAPNNIVVYGNQLDGMADYATRTTASTGVVPYLGSSNFIIDSNSFNQLQTGVSLWAGSSAGGGNGTFSPSFFNQITNNKFTDILTGISYNYSGSGVKGVSFVGNAVSDNYMNNVNTAIKIGSPNTNTNVFQSNQFDSVVHLIQGGSTNSNQQNTLFYQNDFLNHLNNSVMDLGIVPSLFL